MVFDHHAVQDLQTFVRERAQQQVRAESLEEAERAAVEMSHRVGPIVAEVGGRVREAQAAAVQRSLSGLVPEPPGPAVERLCVTMDGSADHIDGDWQEVKTGPSSSCGPRG